MVGVVSLVSVVPEWVAAAATDVAGIGSVVGAANAAAAGATTSVAAAAGDEVSVAIAALFGGFGREYQVVCG
ncbi:PE family protein, partial [Mycobacterium marinum]|uniref:PE family protein n=1 Tax=Mycobacterium marinum TaxID=1781 RepID=UPI002AB171E0